MKKLLLLLLLLTGAGWCSTVTISGNLTDAQGNPLNGVIRMQLPIMAQDITTNTQVTVSPVFYRVVNGVIQSGPPLYDVANLRPTGLYYITSVFDSAGNNVFNGNFVVTAPSPFNLGTATPTSVTTSNVSFANPQFTSATVTGVFTAGSINLRCMADQQTGANWGAKVAACVTSLTSGGIIDATGFPNGSTQTLTSNPFSGVNLPFTLLTGNYTLQYDASSFQLDLPHDFTWYGYTTTVLNSCSQCLGTFVTDTSGRSAQQHTGILMNRVYGTTGSITTGTNTLTVASAANLRLGQTIGVLGAIGGSAKQTTTINQGGGIGTGDSSVTITACSNGACNTVFGNPQYQDNYILIDSEIMSFSGGTATSFTGLVRGLFGTTAATHANGATISQVVDLVSTITAISGTTITLQDNASFTVSSTFVQAGAMNLSIDGNLVLDSNYIVRTNPPTGGGQNFITGSEFWLGAGELVGPQVKLQNSSTSGVFLQGTRASRIQGKYRHIGRPPNSLGSDIFMMCSNRDTIQTTSHEDGDEVIFVEDRSTAITRLSCGSSDNSITLGAIDTTIGYSLILNIQNDSNGNYISFAHALAFCSACTALGVNAGGGSNTLYPTGNTVVFGRLDATGAGGTAIKTNAASGAGNAYYGGTIGSGTISVGANDVLLFKDTTGNLRAVGTLSATQFAGNGGLNSPAVVQAIFASRSAGVFANGADYIGPSVGGTGPIIGDSTSGVGFLGFTRSNETTAPSGAAAEDRCYGDSTLHALKCSYNNGTFFQIPQVITATSAAFATATTAGTCVQNTTAVTGAATTMAVAISPVSAPGVGAVWSAFVSSAGNITINECAVATSAGGTIAFNIRVFP